MNGVILTKLLTPEQAADLLAVEPQTLAVWRCEKRQPSLPYVKVGGRVRYRPSDVQAFIDGNLRSAA